MEYKLKQKRIVKGNELKKFKKKHDKTLKNSSALFRESTVTGVASIVKTKGCCRKLFKIGILIFGLMGFLYQTFQFLQLYWQYSTVSSIERLDKIYKPAITICDANLIRRKFLCEWNSSLCEERYYPCSGNDAKYCVSPEDNYTLIPKQKDADYESEYFELNFTKESGFIFHKILLSCEWRYSERIDDIAKCSTPKFVRGLNKEKLPGACYSLESRIGEKNYTPKYLGSDAGLTFVLKWRFEDMFNPWYFYEDDENTVRAYFISIHDAETLSNPFLEGFKVYEKKEYKVMVSQVNHVRLPPPYSTKCFDYITEWKKNGGKGPKIREDCQKKCEIDENFSRYSCVPRDITYPHDLNLCPNKPEHDPALNKRVQSCAENCRDACLETRYMAQSEVVDKMSTKEATQKYQTPSVAKIYVQFDILKSIEAVDNPKFESWSCLVTLMAFWECGYHGPLLQLRTFLKLFLPY